MSEPIGILLDALTQHMPATGQWLPLAGMVATVAFGLLLLLRGARLAPVLAALTFLGLGGVGGSFLASWLGLPVWPSIAAAGVLGFVLGLVLFRFWLAVLLAGCCVSAALTVYYLRVLHPYMARFTSRGLEGHLVTLPQAGGPAAATPDQQLGQLWYYLGQNVPNFEASFAAIVASAGLAGLVFGLLLPRLARALWAASAGTLFLVVGLTALLEVVAPTALAWLGSLGVWGWALLGTVWAASLAYNLALYRRRRPGKGPPAGKQAEPATAG